MDARSLLESLGRERARFVALARRRVGRQADAEDIVQRALARAAERADSVDDPGRARAWFYRLLRNTIVDHHRAGASDPVRRADADVDVDDLVAVEPARAATPCGCAPRLLDGLDARYAEIIRRVDVDGEDAASVATALGITRGNLDVRLHRARKKLREGVSAYCGVDSHRPCLDCTCDGETRCHSAAPTASRVAAPTLVRRSGDIEG